MILEAQARVVNGSDQEESLTDDDVQRSAYSPGIGAWSNALMNRQESSRKAVIIKSATLTIIDSLPGIRLMQFLSDQRQNLVASNGSLRINMNQSCVQINTTIVLMGVIVESHRSLL